MPLARDLVLGNDDAHPARRRFTCLSPCGPSPALLWANGREAEEEDAP
jgi:hypothetical protein